MRELCNYWFDGVTREFIGKSPLPEDIVLPLRLVSVQAYSEEEAKVAFDV